MFAHTLHIAVKYGMCLVKHKSKRLQKLQNRAARIIMNMSNDVDHLVALDALDWKPLKTERIKAKSKLMFKLLNKMGPKSLIDHA